MRARTHRPALALLSALCLWACDAEDATEDVDEAASPRVQADVGDPADPAMDAPPVPDAAADLDDAAPEPDAGADVDVDLEAADAASPEVPDPDGGGPNADADRPAEDAAPPEGPPVFTRHTVDSMAAGPAYVAVADLNGDGRDDLVVAHLGVFAGFAVPEGQVTVHLQGADLDSWEKQTVVPPDAGVFFPGQPQLHDFDGDGDLDMLIPSGFLVCIVIPGAGPCGGLGWYEQREGGWRRHDVVPVGSELFYHHAEIVDFDGDGLLDLVTVGEEKEAGFGATPERAEAQWFKGTAGPDRFEPTPRVIGSGLGSFPRVLDVDGDGDLDVAGAEFFGTDHSFAWYERVADPSPDAPAGVFEHHVISAEHGPAIMLSFVDDLYGDGVLRAVGSNHSNTEQVPPDPWPSAVMVFDIPEDPRQPWPVEVIADEFTSAVNIFAPQAAPGIFGSGDLDGDGDIDLVVCGDGDPRVMWLEQRGPGDFVAHVLQEGLSQAGGAVVADLDRDGRDEVVVTGYEANVVYIFSRR